jgi:hypothetical protein
MTITDIKSIKFPSITLAFADGLVATINMEEYFSGIKKPLIRKILGDEAAFNTVVLESGSLLWYGVGIDPDELYEYARTKKKISANLNKAATIQTKAIDAWVDKTTMDLFVKFADGKIKKLNMLDALRGLENTWAGEILNPDMFDKVTVKNGMPTWPNEFDFDTDVIYDLGVDVSKKIAGNLNK